MQNVEIIVKNAVEKKSTHLKRDLNVVVRYYKKIWNLKNVNSNNNKVVDIYNIKREFYSLRKYVSEEILDHLWEEIVI